MSVALSQDLLRVYAERRRRREARLFRLLERLSAADPAIAAAVQALRRDRLTLLARGMQQQGFSEARQELAVSEARLRALIPNWEDYPEARYVCPICHDTGDDHGQICRCAREIRRSLDRENGFDFPPPAGADFAHFALERFDDARDPAYYGGKASPREVALHLREVARRWVEEYPEKAPALYFYGKPGTGKTFLASAVATALGERGYRVAFLRVRDYLEKKARQRVLEQSFHPEAGALLRLQTELRYLAAVDALILDDLGSEPRDDRAYQELIALLDGRETGPSQLLILTGNLAPEELARRYDERLLSRLLGNAQVYALEGPDLRLQKTLREPG